MKPRIRKSMERKANSIAAATEKGEKRDLDMAPDRRKIMPLFAGFGASILLLALYFSLMTLLNDFEVALSQFIQLWPWMSLLIIGFGLQIGLFTYLHQQKKMSAQERTSAAAASGASTASMLACCAHHITDVAPLLGISALTFFLAKYQITFLIIGIFSNIFGTVFMLKSMKECGIKAKSKAVGWLLSMNHAFLLKGVVLTGLTATLISAAIAFRGA